MSKIRIGINLLPLFDTIAGAERYAQSIVKALAKIDRENEYILFLNRYNKDYYKVEQDNFTNVVCDFPKNKIARVFYEQFALPERIKNYKLDILFSTCNIAPLRAGCKLVTMMFDVHWLLLPQFFGNMKNFYIKKMLSATAEKSSKILTLSTCSKNDIVKLFGVSPEKVDVTFCGYMPEINGHKTVKDDKYILFVGQFHKRKNIPSLIRAFEVLKDKHAVEHKLYLAGRSGDGDTEILKLCAGSKYADDIKVTGYILDNDLTLLYNKADIFVYPSFYEGFGIPVIEAMAHKVPVACSNASSLPEVAGDGALYFNPHNVSEIAEKIAVLAKDKKVREKLIENGLRQVKKFTWEEVAVKTLEAFKEAAAQN
ncbi:MAG: glycosyltransferase family 1 protein [Armatimonadota bacterium]